MEPYVKLYILTTLENGARFQTLAKMCVCAMARERMGLSLLEGIHLNMCAYFFLNLWRLGHDLSEGACVYVCMHIKARQRFMTCLR